MALFLLKLCLVDQNDSADQMRFICTALTVENDFLCISLAIKGPACTFSGL